MSLLRIIRVVSNRIAMLDVFELGERQERVRAMLFVMTCISRHLPSISAIEHFSPKIPSN